ncbi:hypothetical protein RB195_009372 [Necator americanus]|uniref:Uncharacterized protein n=1 Tax=Necator americanus TaxID=51031 RepID=A0ABR1CT16_NECAM
MFYLETSIIRMTSATTEPIDSASCDDFDYVGVIFVLARSQARDSRPSDAFYSQDGASLTSSVLLVVLCFTFAVSPPISKPRELVPM